MIIKGKDKLEQCHLELQLLFKRVSEVYDLVVLEGQRTQSRQQELFDQGKTKTLSSKHCVEPRSMAVDLAPAPLDFNTSVIKSAARYYHLAGVVKGVAREMKKQGHLTHNVRWGGDWDGDNDFKDQSFDDLVHFELV